jgi:hypothetical protein
MAQLPTKAVAKRLGLGHKEVIRRIRRGDIKAEKLDGGWFWLIQEEEVERVKTADWYQRYLNRHTEEQVAAEA